VSRSAPERLTDLPAAVDWTLSYRPRLDDSDPVVAALAYDAVLRNLAVVAEAVRALPEEVKARAPEVPWPSIAGLRNVVVHEYFRVEPNVVKDVIDGDLAALAQAVRTRLLDAP
jgi:uncharacterized protein with HEPN domain